MGGHYAGALAYADDITLISPSMTGLRKMSDICEQYASEYDILFNGSKIIIKIIIIYNTYIALYNKL